MAKMNMYADDSGCRRSHRNRDDLEREVPPILEKVFEQMKSSRLQVNSEKTTLLVFCDTRKRNNELVLEHSNSFRLKVEGITVEESLTSKLLGVVFDRTSTYEAHIKTQRSTIMGKLTGLWKIVDRLTYQQRKEIAMSRLLSILYFALEVITQTSETYIKQIRMVLSHILKWVHNRPIQRWSRSTALHQCGWPDVELMAMERTLMSSRTVLLTRQSENLYNELVEEGKIKSWTMSTMKQKLKRSWKVRSCRMYEYLGPEFLNRSESQASVKKRFRSLSSDIKQDLIKIFNGETFNFYRHTLWV